MPLVNYTKVTKGTGPVRRLGKIEHGTSYYPRAPIINSSMGRGTPQFVVIAQFLKVKRGHSLTRLIELVS